MYDKSVFLNPPIFSQTDLWRVSLRFKINGMLDAPMLNFDRADSV